MPKKGSFHPYRTAYRWDGDDSTPMAAGKAFNDLEGAIYFAADMLERAARMGRSVEITFIKVEDDRKTRHNLATVDQSILHLSHFDQEYDGERPEHGPRTSEEAIALALHTTLAAQGQTMPKLQWIELRLPAAPQAPAAPAETAPAAPKPGRKGYVYPFKVRYSYDDGVSGSIPCTNQDRVVVEATRVLRNAARRDLPVSVWVEAVHQSTRAVTPVLPKSRAMRASLLADIEGSSTVRDHKEIRAALGWPA